MEKYIVTGSSDKPYINLDHESGILMIGGASLPENVLEVYQPVVDWLREYMLQPNPVTRVKFQFEYLNTASSRMIMQLLEQFLKLREVCKTFSISWIYDKSDLDMRDFGEELIEITDFPIEMVPKEDTV